PEDLPRIQEALEKAAATRQPFEVEGRIRRHDGVFRWFLIRCNPQRDQSGAVVRWYGTDTDIEEIKWLKDRLQDENIALREQIDQRFMFEEIVGETPALKSVVSAVSCVAPTDSTVLLLGETGTGKEL